MSGFFLFCILFIFCITQYYSVKSLQNQYPVFNSRREVIKWVDKQPAYWAQVHEISLSASWPIIISEDWRFYDHWGMDSYQLWRVFKDSLKQGRITRGASTITMQLAKNLFLSPNKTLWRKIREAALALRIEWLLTKTQILEFYLNCIEYGEGLYGIQNAARFYFQKNVNEINYKEGAFLAQLLPNPTLYSQSFRQKKLTLRAKDKIEKILDYLRIEGVLSEAEVIKYTEFELWSE